MKKYIYPLLIGLCLAGCSDEYSEQISQIGLQPQEHFIADAVCSSPVSQSDINRVVSIFGNGSIKSASRAHTPDYTISTIFDSEGNPVIYVVNYSDNAGFVLVSATKDYHPILAYSEKGNYEVLRPKASGVDVWEANTVKAVKESAALVETERISHNMEWLKYSETLNNSILRGSGTHEYISDSEYEELNQIYLASINELAANNKIVYPYERSSWQSILKDTPLSSAENMAKNVYWMYEDIWQDFASIVYWEEYTETVTPATVKSKWHQDDPFNTAFPLLSDNKPAKVGCGPLAVGQIMRYFQYPKTFNWDDMPLMYATTTTSKFLYDIAEAAKAEYKIGETPTKTDNLKNVFTQYGYKSDDVVEANIGGIEQSLKSGSPVMMFGHDAQGTGHSWIATQAKIQYYTAHYDVYNFGGFKTYRSVGSARQQVYSSTSYLYYNWGWGGYPDGYFLLHEHDYNKNLKVLLNIKPK